MFRQSEKLVKQQYLPHSSYNMVNFGQLAAEIVSLVWGTPANFNGFRVLAALLHGTLLVGASQIVALNRGRHLYSAGRPSRWALAHISSLFYVTGIACAFRYLVTDTRTTDVYGPTDRQDAIYNGRPGGTAYPIL